MTIQYQELSDTRIVAVIDTVGDLTSFIGIGRDAGGSTDSAAGSIRSSGAAVPRQYFSVTIAPVTQGAQDGAFVSGEVPTTSGSWASSTSGVRTRLVRNTSALIDANFEVVRKPTSDHDDTEVYPEEESIDFDQGGASISMYNDLPIRSGFIGVRMASASTAASTFMVILELHENAPDKKR